MAACLRKVIEHGPSKTVRVPLLVGPTNAGKSTIFDPVHSVFGFSRVMHKPKLGASCPLQKLAKGDKRFIYFDDNRPVEYAAFPKDNPTVSTLTFLDMFCGQPFDVQVSQSFNDGHPEVVWRRGAAMTAKAEGLWNPLGAVTQEDVRHMKARLEVFTATEQMALRQIVGVPKCGESWSRWLLTDSVAYAARAPPQALPVHHARALPALPIDGDTGPEVETDN